jgi:hypothetical protein
MQISSQAELVVMGGKVVNCLLHEPEHGQKLLQGREALEALMHTPALTWVIQPHDHSHQLLPGNAAALKETRNEHWSTRAPPHLVTSLESRRVAALLHRTRQLLLLVDGTRTIADFCRILHSEPAQLFPLLDALEQEGWIS